MIVASFGWGVGWGSAAQVQVEFGNVEVSPSWFDSWVFQGQSEATLKVRWNMEMEAAIATMEPLQLTEDQKVKLRTAGSGDISRFLRSVGKVRDQLKDKVPDQNNVQEIQQAVEPFQLRLARGLFKDGSLFDRSIAQTLTPEQGAQWKEIRGKQWNRRLNAMIKLVVVRLETKVPLIDEQRGELERILREKTAGYDVPKPQQHALVQAAMESMTLEEWSAILKPEQVKLLKLNQDGITFEDRLRMAGIDIPVKKAP